MNKRKFSVNLHFQRKSQRISILRIELIVSDTGADVVSGG